MRARLQLGVAVGPTHIAAAAVMGVVFAVYLAIAAVVAPPGDAQRAAADPILHILPATWNVPLVVAAGLAVAVAWWWAALPDRATLLAGVGQLGLGCAAAALVVVVVRAIAGPELPDFIPSEESAAPGFTLSMTAGYAEEVLFRLLLVPAVYLPLASRVRRAPAIAIAALVAGLAFALLHEAGGGAWSSAYFATRTIIPGAAMTVVFLRIGPSFLVGVHGAAHVLIPLVF